MQCATQVFYKKDSKVQSASIARYLQSEKYLDYS